MKLIILLTAFLLIIPIKAQDKTMDPTNKALDEIRMKYIPDKRVAVFHIDSKVEDGKTIISGETNIAEVKAEIENKFKGNKYQVNIELLPSKNLDNKIFGVINLSVANIRTKPDHAAELATQALLGTPVKVFEQKRGWYLIQTPDKYISWADDDGVQLMNDKELMQWNAAIKVIYTSNSGLSYSEKDVNSIPVSDLVRGNILKKVQDEGEFTKVEYPDGRHAFVKSTELENFTQWTNRTSPNEEGILFFANKLMGVPYLWGGTSEKGVDCSGFTKTVYYNNGLILSRDASQQVFSGDEVDISSGFDNLKPGDLLFFGRKATDSIPERVTHVAIYIGNMDFIHSSGRVRINSLDKTKENFSEYRFNTLLKAKRILGASNKIGIMEVGNLFNINGMQP